jgi:hypothetical protein
MPASITRQKNPRIMVARILVPTWLLSIATGAIAVPTQGPPHAMITAAPDLNERAVPLQRDFDPGSYINSVISDVGSGVSSWVASGVPQYFQDFPVGDQVQSSLGVSDEDLDAKPTQVLNIPAYANWTNDGWNVRIHGNVYKQPDISQDKLDDLANVFLVDVDVDELSEAEATQARNVTASIFVVQQEDLNVTINFVNDVNVRPDASGGVINAVSKLPLNALPAITF